MADPSTKVYRIINMESDLCKRTDICNSRLQKVFLSLNAGSPYAQGLQRGVIQHQISKATSL